MKRGDIFIGVAIVVVVAGTFISRSCSVCWCSSQTDTANLFVKTVIAEPLRAFRRDVGRYPTTAEGIRALVVVPADATKTWKGPYLDGPGIAMDPWGRPYRYRSPGLHNPASYDVWSYGADGAPSADDIGNW
jgi:general secretion pathway protein G